jgi:hypothetical protein
MNMKKVLFFVMVIALLVGGLAIAKLVDTPITPADLKDLKGAWTGERAGALGSSRTDLTISNDSLPLNGEITMYWPERARRAPATYPCEGQIEDGRLKLFWSNKAGSADLGLRKADDGSMELKGTIVGSGFSGAVTFKKVK